MAFRTQINLPDSIVIFDAVTSISPKFPCEATQHPIEEGSSVSDHVILKNTTLDIEGVITEAITLFSFSLTPTSPREAYQNLLRARENRQVVQVITSIDTFDDMVIVGLSFPRNVSTGQALDINISFEQIDIVTSSFVQESPVTFADDVADDATETQTLGSQATEAVAASDQDSILLRLATEAGIL